MSCLNDQRYFLSNERNIQGSSSAPVFCFIQFVLGDPRLLSPSPPPALFCSPARLSAAQLCFSPLLHEARFSRSAPQLVQLYPLLCNHSPYVVHHQLAAIDRLAVRAVPSGSKKKYLSTQHTLWKSIGVFLLLLFFHLPLKMTYALQ